MANCTLHELDSVITRIGKNCRIIFCGDFRQSDFTTEHEKNGLVDFMKIIKRMKSFHFVDFNENDIVRSSMVKDYIIQKDLLEEASKNNIWYNIHKGLSALEKNYTKDWHTNTLHSYFEYTNQKIENYNFVPWDSFAKWIFLIFKVKNDYKSKLKDDLSETTTSGLDIMKCIEIYTTLKSLYAVDYDKLSDLAQKL